MTFGFPAIHAEPGERRAFLPDFTARIASAGAKVVLEHGYGSGMDFSESDYLAAGKNISFAEYKETLRQDYVVVLRCPSLDDLRLLKKGSCLVSMVHYPTRPERIRLLRAAGAL